MNNKFSLYTISLFLLTFLACQNTDKESKEPLSITSGENLKEQNFIIQTERDTTIISEGGTVISIPKNTFVNTNGESVTGQIKLDFKECLTKTEMVLSNLTTTSNGQFLESGGMIYLNATLDSTQLKIADNKAIEIKLPTDSITPNMQLFEGEKTKMGINWKNPVPLENNIVNQVNDSVEVIKSSNVAYSIKDYHYTNSYHKPGPAPEVKKVPIELESKIRALVWNGDGLMISKDSVIQIDSFEITLVKLDKLNEWTHTYNNSAILGQNTFREDVKANYIFSIRKLGWANIDRLFSDPRTKEIELIVNVKNDEEFDNIYTSMIFKNQNMYIPGYQKKDKSFSFTHGDYEKTSLPVGETVSILITAYKEQQPYIVIETFTIKEKETFNLTLSPTTDSGLKKVIESKI